MSERHDRDAMRHTQPQTTQFHQNCMVSRIDQEGEFPQYGRFSSDWWAHRLRCSQRTVERKVKEYNIPYRKFGDVMYIEASDCWNALPVILPAGEKKPHGGNRRKKE